MKPSIVSVLEKIQQKYHDIEILDDELYKEYRKYKYCRLYLGSYANYTNRGDPEYYICSVHGVFANECPIIVGYRKLAPNSSHDLVEVENNQRIKIEKKMALEIASQIIKTKDLGKNIADFIG